MGHNQASKCIYCSKSRLLHSKTFTDWADNIHRNNLISEIDQIDQREILTQLSTSDSNTDITHDLKEAELQEKSKKEFTRKIDDELIDLEADPQVEILEEISPRSATNLQTVFHQLGSILKSSMAKNSANEVNYEESQKKKAWKELDFSLKECILNASSKRGVFPKDKPEDSLLILMTKKSPAKILTHLYFVLNKLDIFIVQGLATALSRMILLSTPSWKNISNLSPFFVPPRNINKATSANFLRLHILEQEGRGYEDKDVELITVQTPQWPLNITGLRK